jgi:hypothetical protein
MAEPGQEVSSSAGSPLPNGCISGPFHKPPAPYGFVTAANLARDLVTRFPRLARGECLDPREVQAVHAIQRCVRRAFLCGDDPYSGQSYEHRAGNSWQVVLKDDGKLEWVTVKNGVVTAETHEEPMTSPARRAEAKALAILPDDSQL